MTADRNPQVVYGANANYILPALVSIWSLHRRASRPVNVMLYLEAPIEPHDLDLIDRARDRLGLQLERKIFPVNIHSEISGYSELNTKFPAITLLPLVLPGLVEGRCLFLDADTLVMGDVWELLDADMGDKPIGACLGINQVTFLHHRILKCRVSDLFRPGLARLKKKRNIHRMMNLGFVPEENYFNSGLLVMDCDVIRQRFADWRSLADVDRLLPYGDYADQDRLNEYFHEHWFRFPLKWNARHSLKRDLGRRQFRDVSDSLRREMQEAGEDPRMWHFIGRKKPWHKRYGPFRLTRQAFRDYHQVLAEFNAILSHGS